MICISEVADVHLQKEENGADAGPCPSPIRLLSSFRLPSSDLICPQSLCLRGLIAGLPRVTGLEGVTRAIYTQLHWLLGPCEDHSGVSAGGFPVASQYLEAVVTLWARPNSSHLSPCLGFQILWAALGLLWGWGWSHISLAMYCVVYNLIY